MRRTIYALGQKAKVLVSLVSSIIVLKLNDLSYAIDINTTPFNDVGITLRQFLIRRMQMLLIWTAALLSFLHTRYTPSAHSPALCRPAHVARVVDQSLSFKVIS